MRKNDFLKIFLKLPLEANQICFQHKQQISKQFIEQLQQPMQQQQVAPAEAGSAVANTTTVKFKISIIKKN